MLITKRDINDAALTLRQELDAKHERITELFDGATADEQTKDLYDCVTLLHEAAMEGRERGR
jgi:hypothetical protein